MDPNLFWYAQEEASRVDLFLPAGSPASGTEQHYDLVQQRHRRIMERMVRCHAWELQDWQKDNGACFSNDDRPPPPKRPLLLHTSGRLWGRENRDKTINLVRDINCEGYNARTASLAIPDAGKDKCPRDEQYKSRMRDLAEEHSKARLEMLMDSQQARCEDIRLHLAKEALKIKKQAAKPRSQESSTPSTSDVQSSASLVRKRKRLQRHLNR